MPDSETERARTLILEALPEDPPAPEEPEEPDEMGLLNKLRMIAETILFGWFVPGRRVRRGENGDDAKQDDAR